MSGLFGGGGGSSTPVYNQQTEQKASATQVGNANRKRAAEETDTIRTSALGIGGNVDPMKKKTVLGG